MSTTYDAIILAKNPIIYFDGSGTTTPLSFTDVVNGKNITAYRAAYPGGAEASTEVSSHIDRRGVNDRSIHGIAPGAVLESNTDAFTLTQDFRIEFWLKSGTPNGDINGFTEETYVAVTTATDTGTLNRKEVNTIRIGTTWDADEVNGDFQTLEFSVKREDGTSAGTKTVVKLSGSDLNLVYDNQWHFLAFTRISNSYLMHIDDSLYAFTNDTATGSTNATALGGAPVISVLGTHLATSASNGNANFAPFLGYLDKLAIYSGGHTDYQTENYAAGTTAPAQGETEYPDPTEDPVESGSVEGGTLLNLGVQKMVTRNDE